MFAPLYRYASQGVIPGKFLNAVICNDLQGAIGHADDTNLANLPAYTAFFYNEMPTGCWGSEKKMIEWSELKRRDRGENDGE